MRYHPWFFFILFALGHSLLAYFPLPAPTKLAVFFGFLFFPFGIAWAILWDENKKRPHGKKGGPGDFLSHEEIFKPPSWLVLLFLVLLALSRWVRLTTVPFWLVGDEGIEGSFGLQCMNHWDGRLLWGEAQIEPLFVWFLGLGFRLFQPSLGLLRGLPALLSVVSVLGAYLALRFFFNRAFSLVYSILLAFNFWFFLYARLCLTEDLVFPFEALALGLWGLYRRTPSRAGQKGLLLALGLVAGLGFYSYTAWAALACWLSLVLFWEVGAKAGKPRDLAFYLVPLALVLVPLVRARATPDGISYLQSLFSPGHSFPSLGRYVAGLFWYGFGTVPYGPAWGGLLNSLEGALVGVGLLGLFQKRRFIFLSWLLLAFLVGLLPGALAQGMDMNRICALLPAALLACALGTVFLLAELPKPLRGPAFLALAGISAALNFHHFTGPYLDAKNFPPDKKAWRVVEYAKAYDLLKSRSASEGPLYVLNDFNLDYDNKTLDLACYPFDAFQNPSLPREKVRSVALLTDIYYAPFLHERFPESQWFWLKPDADLYQSNFVLGFIPLGGIPAPTLQAWWGASEDFHQVNLESKDKTPGQEWLEINRHLLAKVGDFEADPFLQSLFWERVAMYYTTEGHCREAAAAYRRAVQKGYPARHLFYNMGMALDCAGEASQARQAVERAKKPSPHRRFISQDLDFIFH